MFDCVIIGGGIVGLATALELGKRQPGIRLAVLEKEADLALHQTGRNSGVIHSGIYYKPGSFKASFAREGNRSMVEFCQERGIPYEVCGKIIVATERRELPSLEKLHRRGIKNGLQVEKLTSEEAQEIEPHVRCIAALKVDSTGIVGFRSVCLKFAELICQQGGVIKTGAPVEAIRQNDSGHVLETAVGAVETKFLINCGGLQSDRLARLAGLAPKAQIVPFRGEYYELTPEKRHLVKTLVYPVPNEAFPFLGVHFTRMIDGSVHAGPNAVLAFKREGYLKTDVDFNDLFETLRFPGFWKMARMNFREGFMEIVRSASKQAFLASLQRLVPEIESDDLIASESGVRAQALLPDGNLVDDFLFERGWKSLHVCNAPSPAATASLEIGKAVAEQLPDLRTAVTKNCGGKAPR